jgi:YggT family protein
MNGILLGIADVLEWLLWAFRALIFVAAILSWVQADPFNPIVRAVRAMTLPVFDWLRQRLPFLVQGGIDFSPLAAFLITLFLDKALVFNLRQWGLPH